MTLKSLGLILCVLLYPANGFGQTTTTNQPTRSIRDWVVGDGKTDDTKGVAAAFAACRHNAFTLLVDCPVLVHVGTDIARPVFIDDGTTVDFSGDGLFIVDNVLIPTFVIANSGNIKFTHWNVEYRGGLPIDHHTGGYLNNGVYVAESKYDPGAFAFEHITLTNWLKEHRDINFDNTAAVWTGPSNSTAIFFLIGSTNHLEVSHLKIFAPLKAGGHQFIPMCFSLHYGHNSNQTVTSATPVTSQFYSVPSDLRFDDVDLDGFYFGWQGSEQHAQFTHVRAHRYADLQDENGNQVGGVGKWFAPPHLFYLNYQPANTGLENRDIQISDVIDFGNRVGTARDRAGETHLSGYANSLKIGAIDGTVDNYTSYRPDGLVDVLTCEDMKLSNITATYDSSFLNDIFPGIRFPSPPFKRLTLSNITLTDLAPHPHIPPIGSSSNSGNSQIDLENIKVTLNEWTSAKSLEPTFTGDGNRVDVTFDIKHPLQDPTRSR